MLLGSSRNFASKTKVAKKVAAVVKKKVKSAVYGCGLSASGALAIPRLVVNEDSVTSREVHRPLRITHMNTRGIKHIAAGFGFSLFASKNKLFGSGLNNRFQITSHVRDVGTKLQEYYISAKRIQLPSEAAILSVSSGRSHSLVATTSGVYAFGDNTHGQCGQDPEKHKNVHGLRDTPLPVVEIPSDSPAVAVHCALDTSFVLTESGEVFAFGLNEDGQCANNCYGIQSRPTKILGDAASEKITSISGSSDTIVALSDKGELFIWGQCEYGQAVVGANSVELNLSRYVPFPPGKIVSVGSTASSCVANTDNGEIYVWGVGLIGLGPSTQKLDRPTLMDQPLFGKEKIAKVYAGNTSCGAISSSGRLFVWGQNRFGSLGLEHGNDQYFPLEVFFPYDVKHISLGPDHSLFLMR
ncbi:Williams-Beuren syndrome chromosomal region 16 protein [Trichostrongylus colubriformis]|uniref:Williams-Beuren syndrome chromosomal region 16 protein n=1 Tax=Trichostrongylus colubriformis TaxID=6319 RepID=A0AAN8FWQ4_TRICO